MKLVIFDADGTLRYTTIPGQHYPLAPDQWRLLPGVGARVSSLAPSTRIGVASNQPGVTLGLLSKESAEAMIRETLAAAGAKREVILEMCTCRADRACPRMKPEPGMLLAILEKCRVAARDALYVGDLEIDREAARRAGVAFEWADDFFERG